MLLVVKEPAATDNGPLTTDITNEKRPVGNYRALLVLLSMARKTSGP